MNLGLGCVNLGSASGARSPRRDVQLVRHAFDAGVRLFDTAGAYGNGASERILGRALGRHRGEVVIATKGGYLFRERSILEQSGRRLAARALKGARVRRVAGGAPTGGGAGRAWSAYQAHDDSPRHLRTEVEASLRRRGTDHIDVYQLHAPRYVRPHVFDELEDLVRAGKVGRFGIGAESVTAAVEWLQVPAVQVVQVPFGILDPQAATDLLPCVRSRPVDVWIRGVLGGGLVALVSREPATAAADPKGPVLARLADLSARSGHALDALAVGYVRTFSGVSTMLIGISSRRHLERNLALVDGPALPPDVLAALADIAVGAGAPRSGGG